MSNKIIKSAGPSKKSGEPTPSIKKIKPNKKLTLEEELEEIIQNEKLLKQNINNKGYNSKKLNKYINKILGDTDPTIKYIKNLKYNGNDLISVRINENVYEHKKYSINKIQRLSDKLSDYLLKKQINGKMMTAMIYGDLNWKSGYFKPFGERTVLYDPNELYNSIVPYEKPKTIKSFNIYIALGNRDIGGSDDLHNDCLYNCLKYFIFNIEDYFKSPSELKKFLKLNRDDKIPLNKIDDIEKKLKNYQINIRGNFKRSSTIKSNKIINLNLIDEHYSIEKIDNKFLKLVRFNEKHILLFDKETFEVFDGINKYKLSKQEHSKIIYDCNNENIIIDRNKNQGHDDNGNRILITIEEEYANLIEIADALKKESNGMINLYKTGSFHDTALNLFDRISKFINPENILQDESEWINNSLKGGLIFAENFEGQVYKYDVKSLYPYLMQLNELKFPVKRGEFQTLKSFDTFFQFGIYRCNIHKSEDENLNRLFKFNKTNFYTSIDLTNAKELNLKIELIEDEKPNFLYYSRDKLITFKEVFDNYINLLFPLKENKVKYSKDILNILWGALCEKDKRTTFIKDTFKITDCEEIIEIYPTKDEEGHIIKTIKINSIFKSSFARLGSFLTSQGRRHMSKMLLPHKDYIKRVQTDGFLITKQLENSNVNVDIGQLKYEGYTENAIIKNCINQVKVHY